MTSFRFRDPQLARMAAVAARLGATMHADDDCADCQGEQHYGSTSGSTTDKPWNGAASRFTDEQYKMATAACDPGTGTSDGPTIKAGCFLPHHEPDGTTNVNGVHAAAQRAGSLKGHDSGAVSRAKAHLRSHYSKLKEDPPDSIAASAEARAEFDRLMGEIALALDADPETPALEEMFANLHEKFSGTHSHPHAAYGQQGGDETHEHSHTHDGDNLHKHSHADASTDPVAASGSGRRPSGGAQSFRKETPADRAGRWESILAGLAFVAGAEPGQDSDPFLGAAWAVKQDGDKWYVLARPGTMQAAGWQTVAPSYTDALAVIMEHLSQDSRPVLDQGWKSEMAYEGVSTGDGRYIEPGAIEYRNCPLPLMLQTETESGHMGAVLAGAIKQTGKIGQIAIGAGDFDATDAGRQALQIIQARDRFGVSIDVADADGAPICETHGTDTDQCDFDCDWEYHFTLIRVMGLTMTPFPAFEDAYIELATVPDTGQAQAASGAPNLAEALADLETASTAGGRGLASLTAAGGTAKKDKVYPLAEYFERPDDWESLLVRQPSGGYAVPLTVEEPDEHGFRRVYGSVADKRTCHTGIPGRCQTAPMSRDGQYPGFNLKPVMTAEGEMVNVGHITMGCGHASTTMRLSPDQVRAHYDGAPGAVSMAWAHAGQDEHGPWIAGIINPARTEEEIEQFAMMSVSGDWRKEWPGRGYDMFAVLAGVPVPGFPIAASAALVAAGVHFPTGPFLPAEPCFELDDEGEPLALVAMGVVRQPMPWDREMMVLRKDRDDMAARLEQAEKMLQPLRPIIAQVLTARLDGLDPLAAFAAPTSLDATVSGLLTKAVAALHAVMAAQAQDPDNGKDPDDSAVQAHLTAAKNALDEAALAQAKDAAEPADA